MWNIRDLSEFESRKELICKALLLIRFQTSLMFQTYELFPEGCRRTRALAVHRPIAFFHGVLVYFFAFTSELLCTHCSFPFYYPFFAGACGADLSRRSVGEEAAVNGGSHRSPWSRQISCSGFMSSGCHCLWVCQHFRDRALPRKPQNGVRVPP